MKGIYWRSLTFKKSVIYLKKVICTSYNYTPCDSTWTCLLLEYSSRKDFTTFWTARPRKFMLHSAAPKKIQKNKPRTIYLGRFSKTKQACHCRYFFKDWKYNAITFFIFNKSWHKMYLHARWADIDYYILFTKQWM